MRLERMCKEKGVWLSEASEILLEEATNLIEDGSSFDPDALYQIRTVIDFALEAPLDLVGREKREYFAALVKEVRHMTAQYGRKFDRDVALVPTMRTLTAQFSAQIRLLTLGA